MSYSWYDNGKKKMPSMSEIMGSIRQGKVISADVPKKKTADKGDNTGSHGGIKIAMAVLVFLLVASGGFYFLGKYQFYVRQRQLEDELGTMVRQEVKDYVQAMLLYKTGESLASDVVIRTPGQNFSGEHAYAGAQGGSAKENVVIKTAAQKDVDALKGEVELMSERIDTLSENLSEMVGGFVDVKVSSALDNGEHVSDWDEERVKELITQSENATKAYMDNWEDELKDVVTEGVTAALLKEFNEHEESIKKSYDELAGLYGVLDRALSDTKSDISRIEHSQQMMQSLYDDKIRALEEKDAALSARIDTLSGKMTGMEDDFNRRLGETNTNIALVDGLLSSRIDNLRTSTSATDRALAESLAAAQSSIQKTLDYDDERIYTNSVAIVDVADQLTETNRAMDEAVHALSDTSEENYGEMVTKLTTLHEQFTAQEEYLYKNLSGVDSDLYSNIAGEITKRKAEIDSLLKLLKEYDSAKSKEIQDSQDEISGSLRVLNDQIRTSAGNLKKELESTADEITLGYEQVAHSLAVTIRTTSETLTKNLNDTRDELNDNITTTKNELNDNIGQTKEELQQEIRDLQTRVDELEKEVNDLLALKLNIADSPVYTYSNTDGIDWIKWEIPDTYPKYRRVTGQQGENPESTGGGE